VPRGVPRPPGKRASGAQSAPRRRVWGPRSAQSAWRRDHGTWSARLRPAVQARVLSAPDDNSPSGVFTLRRPRLTGRLRRFLFGVAGLGPRRARQFNWLNFSQGLEMNLDCAAALVNLRPHAGRRKQVLARRPHRHGREGRGAERRSFRYPAFVPDAVAGLATVRQYAARLTDLSSRPQRGSLCKPRNRGSAFTLVSPPSRCARALSSHSKARSLSPRQA